MSDYECVNIGEVTLTFGRFVKYYVLSEITDPDIPTQLKDTVVICTMSCRDPIEKLYYSAKLEDIMQIIYVCALYSDVSLFVCYAYNEILSGNRPPPCKG